MSARPHGAPGLPERKRPRRSRVRRILLYGATRGLTEGLLAARGLTLAALLSPAAFGAWSLFRLAARYATLPGIGALRGLEREISQAAQHPGSDAAPSGLPGSSLASDLTARTSLTFTSLVSLAISAVALAVSFAAADADLVLGLRALAAGMPVEALFLYTLVYVRSRGDLRTYAQLEVLSAAFQLTLCAALAWLLGLPGAFAGFVLAHLCVFARSARRLPLRPALSIGRLRRLLRVGVPQALTIFLGLALVSADKLVVAAYGGMDLLGYYAFAGALAGLAATLGLVIRVVVFQEVYGEAVRSGHVPAVREHLSRTLLPFAWLVPPLVGLAAIAAGPAVQLLLPRYEPALAAARLFVFTGVTSGLLTLAMIAVVAADRQRGLPGRAALALVANLSLSALALRSGAGLTGVAAAAVASQGAYSASVLLVALRAAHVGRPGLAAARALLPVGWCVAATAAATALADGPGLGSAGIALGIYGLLLLPLVPFVPDPVRRLSRRSGSGDPRPALPGASPVELDAP
ncbi:MAG: lipopolysaccharide biosynthesis protein [Gemmatimonadota bacterium]